MTAANAKGHGKARFARGSEYQPARDGAADPGRCHELLAERGYEAVTFENVAAEAGVNKASIRYNFGNKAGLVAAVVDA